MMTLEEHKAAMAAEEAAELEATPQVDEDETEDEAPELEPEEPTQETETVAAEDEESEDEQPKEEPAAWMQSEGETSQNDDLANVPDAAWAAMRRKMDDKYSAKLSNKEEKLNEAHQQEVADLKAQIAAQGNPAPQVGARRPQRSDFDHLDNYEDAYDDALYSWRKADEASKSQQAAQQEAAKNYASAQNAALDGHYSAAEKLCKASNIDAETFQASDFVVKNALGEQLTSALIANMGEGSEKVFYNLGRNPAKLAKLQEHLRTDPNGLKAMMYLGELKTGLTAAKRKTLAPKPATTVQGDKKSSRTENAAKKAYDKAHKSGDTQKAWAIKQESKAAGHQTRTW